MKVLCAFGIFYITLQIAPSSSNKVYNKNNGLIRSSLYEHQFRIIFDLEIATYNLTLIITFDKAKIYSITFDTKEE